ncbi:MAG: polysaccharide deacetylase family protein [Clostridiales bacterium]|nr:polysaccharide deacetylase family protein [Clostridiales bacterium]
MRAAYRFAGILLFGVFAVSLAASFLFSCGGPVFAAAEKRDFIKWVDFDVPHAALEKALQFDIESHDTARPLDWVELLAFLSAKYGGDFSRYKAKDLDVLAKKLLAGQSMEELTAGMKSYPYYLEACRAVLGGFVGSFRIQVPGKDDPEKPVWEERYGLKAFSPIAAGFDYEDYDDFGKRRSYGYGRRHLGHDLFGEVGTPIVAVESGVVQTLGWNQYGGWRVGIRSFDGTRYYYYAHLRKNRPYAAGLEEGQVVKAGDVIGYMGRTGYSAKENTNNIKEPHLHLGLQLIFDPSQEQGSKEIWVDLCAITQLLQKNRSVTVRDPQSKEFSRKYDFDEPLLHRSFSAPPGRGETLMALPDFAGEADRRDGLGETGALPGFAGEALIPVVMYHRLSEDRGSLGKYTITPEEFESDLLYLQEHGYVTVTVDDLLAFVKKGVPLPEKPVMLTFDDGYHSDYRYVFPLLRKYGAKAVFAVIGSVTDQYSAEGRENARYPHLTWPQIKEMAESGLAEFQNHSYDLHKGLGARRRDGESLEQFKLRLGDDLHRLQERMSEVTGSRPTAFIYPFGAISAGSAAVLRELGFQAAFTCYEKNSLVRLGEPESLFSLGRYLRPHGCSSEQLFRRMGLE